MWVKRCLLSCLLIGCGGDPDDLEASDLDARTPDQGLADGGPEDEGPQAPIAALLNRIDGDRLWGDIEALVDLGERSSYDGQTAAAAYLRQELGEISGALVFEHTYEYQSQTYTNFEATIIGRNPERFVIMGAHYDSTSENPLLAPGADDDASGTAAVLEAARVFAGGPVPEISVRLLLFSNEEKGTVGSQRYASYLAEEVPTENVVGLINVDMIAYGEAGEDLDLATRPEYQDFLHDTADAVLAWTDLDVNRIIDDHCG